MICYKSEKSVLIPTQKIEFSSLIVDSIKSILSLTPEELAKMHQSRSEMCKALQVSIL